MASTTRSPQIRPPAPRVAQGTRSGTPTRRRRFDTPRRRPTVGGMGPPTLVGRTRELAELEDVVERSRRASGRSRSSAARPASARPGSSTALGRAGPAGTRGAGRRLPRPRPGRRAVRPGGRGPRRPRRAAGPRRGGRPCSVPRPTTSASALGGDGRTDELEGQTATLQAVHRVLDRPGAAPAGAAGRRRRPLGRPLDPRPDHLPGRDELVDPVGPRRHLPQRRPHRRRPAATVPGRARTAAPRRPTCGSAGWAGPTRPALLPPCSGTSRRPGVDRGHLPAVGGQSVLPRGAGRRRRRRARARCRRAAARRDGGPRRAARRRRSSSCASPPSAAAGSTHDRLAAVVPLDASALAEALREARAANVITADPVRSPLRVPPRPPARGGVRRRAAGRAAACTTRASPSSWPPTASRAAASKAWAELAHHWRAAGRRRRGAGRHHRGRQPRPRPGYALPEAHRYYELALELWD